MVLKERFPTQKAILPLTQLFHPQSGFPRRAVGAPRYTMARASSHSCIAGPVEGFAASAVSDRFDGTACQDFPFVFTAGGFDDIPITAIVPWPWAGCATRRSARDEADFEKKRRRLRKEPRSPRSVVAHVAK
jgi:hypothetical protein